MTMEARGLIAIMTGLAVAAVIIALATQILNGQLPATALSAGNEEFNWFLPYATVHNETQTKDASGDGVPETYVLLHGRLTVSQAGQRLWQSPAEWWIDRFALAEATNEGNLQIAMSVWKSGNFGSSQPRWIKENDPSVKNHFFVFGWRQGKITAVWQSSNLSRPNCEFTFADVNKDGQQELVVIEGSYNKEFKCQGQYLAVWKWREWGFENLWRSQRWTLPERPFSPPDQWLSPGLAPTDRGSAI